MELIHVLAAGLIGVGATVLTDFWALFLRRAFKVRSLDYCLLGRWVMHMPAGVILHERIAAASKKQYECIVGSMTHYLIGTGFGVLFVLIASTEWLTRPTLMPALAFGAATVIVPYFTMQPAFGLGIAASRAPHPTKVRLKSLMTHTVFGVGLYVSALLASRIQFQT